jgi:hypothetical protein
MGRLVRGLSGRAFTHEFSNKIGTAFRHLLRIGLASRRLLEGEKPIFVRLLRRAWSSADRHLLQSRRGLCRSRPQLHACARYPKSLLYGLPRAEPQDPSDQRT